MRNAIATTVVVGIVVALLAPLALRSRELARQMQSANNLKQLTLGVLNYESAFSALPPGTDATNRHGTVARMRNYLESSSVYHRIDWQRSWNHPLNRHLFGVFPATVNPCYEQTLTVSGFGLMHYGWNQELIHRGSSVREVELGTSRNRIWLVAERTGAFRPWGSPYQWMNLQQAVRSSDATKSHQPIAMQIATLDGAVHRFEYPLPGVVPQILGESQATNLGPDQLQAPPVQEYEFANVESLKYGAVKLPRTSPAQSLSKLFHGELTYARQYATLDLAYNQRDAEYCLANAIVDYPQMDVVILRCPITPAMVDSLATLKHLQHLSFTEDALTPASRQTLHTYPGLTIYNNKSHRLPK